MNKKNTAYHEMTNDDFMEKLKQECESNEELREEVKEIKGIFIRALIEYLNSEDYEAFKMDMTQSMLHIWMKRLRMY